MKKIYLPALSVITSAKISFLYMSFRNRSALLLFNKVILVSMITFFFANSALADYTIPAGSTIDPATTPALLNATDTIFIYGTMSINTNVTFTSATPLTIIIYGPSGEILWNNNVTLAFPAGTSILFVNNPTPGLQPDSGPGLSASKILQIGTIKYAAANDNSNNVVYSFSQLNSIGGTARVNPSANANPICYGSSLSLSANPVTPSGDIFYILWSISPISGAFSDNNTSTAINTTLSGLAANIYTVTCELYSNAGNNTYFLAASKTITITVNPLPTSPTTVTATPATICAGSSSNINATSSGNTIQWYTASTGGTSIGSCLSATNYPVSPASTTTYYAEALNATTGCTSASRNSVAITVNPLPTPVTVSGGGAHLCGTSTTLAATGGTGGTIYYEGTLTNGMSTSTASASQPITTSGTYYFRAQTAAGCWGTQDSAVVAFHNLWTGTNSIDWNTSGNWSDNQLPSTTCPDVYIPATPNQPTLSNSPIATINNLHILSGATLTVNGIGTLQIAGTISNSGTFDVSNGTLEFNGTASQTIPANAFVSNALNNLIISNTGTGVTLGGTLNLFGTLSFGAVNSKTFSTGGYLTLKSSATGTAGVADLTNNGSNSGNSITGNVTVERYISARKAWRFLSIPTNTTQTVKQTWQEGCGANLNCVAGFGTQITGPGGTAAGFDVYTATPSMKTYNPATNTWVGIPNTNSTIIKATDGYMVFIRGDRTATAFNSTPTQTVLRTKGYLYTGTQSPIVVSATNWASIGNPYASVLDMRSISKTGLKDFFYVWDPQLAGSYGYGGYQTFSKSGGNYVIIPGGGSYGIIGSISNYIQSEQAFFVQATATGGSLTFTEGAKASGSSLVTVAASIPQPQLLANLYGVNTDSSTYMADGLLINYDDSYSNSVDDLDALKSTNTSENLSVKTDNTLLVVERRHTITRQDTIFLNLTNVKAQQYRFEFSADQLYQPGLTGFLVDNYLNTSTPLHIDGTTTINFNIVNIPGSYAANRFMIVFSTTPTGVLPVTFTSVKAYQQGSNINVEWKVDNETNMKQYEVEKSKDGSQFATIATVPATNNNGGSASYSITDANPVEGYNYYRIKSVDLNGTTARTNVVKVLISKINQEITVYPNPVINGKINLVLNNQPAGKYNIRIFNKSGQVIKESVVQHSQGNSTETIQLDNYISRGIYNVEVNRPDGTQTNIKVVY